MLHLVTHLAALSNEDILSSLKALVADGNRILVKVLADLGEVEERRIHLELACGSMFEFWCARPSLGEEVAM